MSKSVAPDLSLTSAYDYSLPPGRIARYPAQERDSSRLLVFPRDVRSPGSPSVSPPFRDLHFFDLPTLLRAGDLLVVNESRVLPVRLLGRKPTGAECEVLLLRPVSEESAGAGLGRRWEALVRPGSKLKPGRSVIVADDLKLVIEDGIPGGGRIVRVETSGSVEQALDEHGRVPLPPYLDRQEEPIDKDRYQTVYARDPGSVAAPTAGLHFTPRVLGALAERGVEVARVSLHVGPGTFRPVDADRIAEHRMDREFWRIPHETVEAIARARTRDRRVWAVGTTVVRTLEAAALDKGGLGAGQGTTDLFIKPGFRFRVVDALITNFHLPKSTLLMLVAAFAGHARTMEAYRHAVDSGYRFYSYGDAMAILPFPANESE